MTLGLSEGLQDRLLSCSQMGGGDVMLAYYRCGAGFRQPRNLVVEESPRTSEVRGRQHLRSPGELDNLGAGRGIEYAES